MPIRFLKQTILILVSASDIHGVLGAVEVTCPGAHVPPGDVALTSAWDRPPVWVHGDVVASNGS